MHSFGDVVLVPFPFADLSGAKKRPAVIVSNSGYHASRRDLMIMAITSQVRQPLGLGEALIKDWQGAGLIKPSVLKPVLTTIEQGLLLRSMGALSATICAHCARLSARLSVRQTYEEPLLRPLSW